MTTVMTGIKLKGFKLLNHFGSYPIAIQSKNKKDVIIGELCSVEDREFQKLKHMEESAGYTCIEINISKDSTSYMFVQDEEELNYNQEIDKDENGEYDWIKFTNKTIANELSA